MGLGISLWHSHGTCGDGWHPDAVDGGTGWCYVQMLKEIPVSKRKAWVQTFEFGYYMASLADLIRPRAEKGRFSYRQI